MDTPHMREIRCADDVLDARRLLGEMSYADTLPSATVLAERDWLHYVQAMTEAVPAGNRIAFPTEAEVSWAWPDGVLILLETPLEVEHTIISRETRVSRASALETVMPDGTILAERVPATNEMQLTAGLAIVPGRTSVLIDPEGNRTVVEVTGVLWIGADVSDVITSTWMQGNVMLASELGVISHSSRLLLSIITALGHRLTRIETPTTTGRGERRRVQRELPGLRVLQLGTGSKPTRSDEPGTVDWTHRWLVRGHWRQQPHGFNRQLRRLKWIDPYVKGPEDKPLDVRPTLWRTGHPE